MKLNPEQLDRKQKILLAAAAIGLGRRALRSYKYDGELMFDIMIYGEKTKTVLLSMLSETKEKAAKLAGTIILGANSELDTVLPEEEGDVPEESLDILEAAVDDNQGWSGSENG